MAYEVPITNVNLSQQALQPMELQSQGLALGQAQLKAQRETEQYNQQKAQQRALQDLAAKSDFSSDEGKADFIRQAYKINPQIGMDLEAQQQKGALTKAQIGEQQSLKGLHEKQTRDLEIQQTDSFRKDMVSASGQIFGATISKTNNLPTNGPSYKAAMDEANAEIDKWSKTMRSAYGDNPRIASILDQIDKHDFKTVDEMKQFQQSLGAVQQQKLGPGEITPAAVQQRIQIAKAGAQNRAELRETPEEAAAKAEAVTRARQGVKAEMSLQGGRESVFNQRVMNSANEAVAALQNLVQLPISSSTGFAGYGRHRTGIFDAGKEALAAKLTTQDQQLYSTMIAGLTRSMASIEMSGLAGGQRLSEQIGPSVTMNPEDTQLTKLSKLAEARQIVERGMETLSTNPRLSPEQRGLIEKVNRDVARAIPWTQQDIINLSNAQAEGRNVSLRDVMKQKQGSATNSAPAEAIEHLKAHPELKEAFKEKYGYLPSGI